MRLSIFLRLIMTFVSFLYGYRMAVCQEGNDQMAALAVAADGYKNNIDSFTNFRCSFQVAGHTASSLQDAIAGRYTGKIGHVSEGLWLVKKPWERYILSCDPNVIENAKKQMHEPPSNPNERFGVVKACLTQDYLSNGRFQLDRGVFLSVAHLFPSESQNLPHRYGIDPLRLDIRGASLYPDSLFRKCLKNEWYGNFEGVREVNGRNVMVITCGESKNRLHSRFFLDPERGFLPIRDEFLDPDSGKKRIFAVITDFISCSGGRWFPRRSLTFSLNPKIGEGPPYTDIREIKVTNLDINADLKDDDFTLKIPKGYQVTMPPNRFALLAVKDNPLIVTPSSMDKLYKQLLDSEAYWKTTAAYNASLKTENRGLLFFWICQGFFFAIITVYIIFNRLRRRV